MTTVEHHHGAGGFNPFTHPDLGWKYVLFQIVGTTASSLTCRQPSPDYWPPRIARRTEDLPADMLLLRMPLVDPGIWGIAALATIGWLPLAQLSPAEVERIPSEIREKIANRKSTSRWTVFLTPAEIQQLDKASISQLHEASLHAMLASLATSFLSV